MKKIQTQFCIVLLAILAGDAASAQTGKFFAAAKDAYGGETQGFIMSSVDGLKWDIAYKYKTEELRGIAAGNGKIVAISKNGILTSGDGGKTWKDVQIAGADEWFEEIHDIAFGGGMFLAVGTKETIIYSTDGENWKRWTNADGGRKSFTHPDPTLERRFVHYYGVTFANNCFVLVGGSNRVAKLMLNNGVLTLGKSQVLDPSGPPAMCRDIAYDGKKTMVMGGGSFKTYVSTDMGETWNRTEHASMDEIGVYSIAFLNGKFVLTGRQSRLWTSVDGVNYKDVPTSDDRRYMWDSAYGNGMYVAVGDNMLSYTSKDGMTWKINDAAGPKNISVKRMVFVK